MNELLNAAKTVNDQRSFAIFLSTMADDFKSNPTLWENRDLGAFLEAMASWVEEMDGFYRNMEGGVPRNVNWKVFADALMGARVYE
jgi:hypothetical protein